MLTPVNIGLEDMENRFQICTAGHAHRLLIPHDIPVKHGYKECPICHKLVKAQGFGGHMHGVHSVKVGQKARLADLQQRLERYDDLLGKVLFWDSQVLGFMPGYKLLAIKTSDSAEK